MQGGAFLRIASLVVGDAIRRGEMTSNRSEDHEVSMLALAPAPELHGLHQYADDPEGAGFDPFGRESSRHATTKPL